VTPSDMLGERSVLEEHLRTKVARMCKESFSFHGRHDPDAVIVTDDGKVAGNQEF